MAALMSLNIKKLMLDPTTTFSYFFAPRRSWHAALPDAASNVTSSVILLSNRVYVEARRAQAGADRRSPRSRVPRTEFLISHAAEKI